MIADFTLFSFGRHVGVRALRHVVLHEAMVEDDFDLVRDGSGVVVAGTVWDFVSCR
jgi:hypothetical protein